MQTRTEPIDVREIRKMKDQLLEIINEILEDKGKTTLNDINENTSLRRDAGMDSIDLAVLTARIDEEYDVDIFEGGIVDTVGEVLKKLG